MSILRGLYDWTMRLASHRHALPALAAVSFIESSVFPIPPDVMLVPMILAERRRAFVVATVCTAASVAGGVLGYVIGYALWETFGRALIEFYGYATQMATFTAQYNDWGGWIVFTAGLTPFPYKVITIASGVARMDLAVFVFASVIGRGMRFYLEAWLLYHYGPPIRGFIERHMGKLAVLFVALLFGGYLAIRLLA